MNVREAVASRRVVRDFADRPLEPAALIEILDAGRRAGSSKNLQRWTFIVVRQRDRLETLARSGPWAGHIAGAAAAVALVTPDPRAADAPLSVMWDLGGVAAQMMLVAWELRIGSCPATVYDQPLVQELLGLPGGCWCEYIVSFGYPADAAILDRPLRRGGRRPLADIVREERW